MLELTVSDMIIEPGTVQRNSVCQGGGIAMQYQNPVGLSGSQAKYGRSLFERVVVVRWVVGVDYNTLVTANCGFVLLYQYPPHLVHHRIHHRLA